MISVNRVKIPRNGKKYIDDCLKTEWISGQGPYVTKFEDEFSHYIGRKYAFTTNSGTAALHLALEALEISNGDEVILPSLTIGACFFAIWQTGATAVPVDVSPHTYNIDPQKIEAAITQSTKAIMVVHLYGFPCDMDAIMSIAKRHKLFVIEDAAEAHGALYKGRRVGTFGTISCFSFYANKVITSGEGGALLTDSPELAHKIRRLKNFNFVDDKRFTHYGLGYNYQMSNMEAALALASLEEVSLSLGRKQKMARVYTAGLSKIAGVKLPPLSNDVYATYWMYAIIIEPVAFGCSKMQLMQELLDTYGIQTRSFFYPPQIAFEKMGVFKNQEFPIATALSENGLYLPSGIGNTISEFKVVITAIKNIHERYS